MTGADFELSDAFLMRETEVKETRPQRPTAHEMIGADFELDDAFVIRETEVEGNRSRRPNAYEMIGADLASEYRATHDEGLDLEGLTGGAIGPPRFV
jgi:hypothetical protein